MDQLERPSRKMYQLNLSPGSWLQLKLIKSNKNKNKNKNKEWIFIIYISVCIIYYIGILITNPTKKNTMAAQQRVSSYVHFTLNALCAH